MEPPYLVLSVFVAVILFLLGTTLQRRVLRRRNEIQLQSILLGQLLTESSSVTGESLVIARSRTDAMIPCRGQPTGSQKQRHGLICWADTKMLVVLENQLATSLPYSEIKRLTIGQGAQGGKFAIDLEGPEGPVNLEVQGTDNLVRMVNLAVNHRVATGCLGG